MSTQTGHREVCLSEHSREFFTDYLYLIRHQHWSSSEPQFAYKDFEEDNLSMRFVYTGLQLREL